MQVQNKRRLGLWIALPMAACVPFAYADQGQKTPGAAAYDQVQAMRNEANKLIDEKASSDDLHKAIAQLDQALAVLDQPQDQEMAYGNVYLRFRRLDVELDLANAYAQLGDKSAALDHLEAAVRVASLSGLLESLPKQRPGLQSLRSEPRYQRLVEQSAAIDRLWKHPDIATPYSETLTAEQRIAGLSLFWSEVNYNFVYFDHNPKLNWDKIYLDFLPQVLAAKTTRDYYEVLMRLAPLLQDGHTNIYPPKELQSEFYSRPPMRTTLVEGRVLVSEVWSPTLEKQGVHVGDEIIAIDGEKVHDYAEKHIRPYQSSSTTQDADVRMYTYALLSGDAAKLIGLTLRDVHGLERTLNISRGHYDDVQRPVKPPFRDLGQGVVYVDVDQFENDKTVKAFEKALPDIFKAKALVIDVRDNGGGSTNCGLEILSYLSSAPIPTMLSRVRDYDPYMRAQVAGRIAWSVLYDYWPDSKAHGQIFTGPVAVLIGPRTFSAGEDFVASFDLMHRGILVGAATGGSTGQPLMVKLPGGGTARICIKRDEYPDGREFVGKGIQPTIAVAPSVFDVRAGRDPVIDRAKVELLKNAH